MYSNMFKLIVFIVIIPIGVAVLAVRVINRVPAWSCDSCGRSYRAPVSAFGNECDECAGAKPQPNKLELSNIRAVNEGMYYSVLDEDGNKHRGFIPPEDDK